MSNWIDDVCVHGVSVLSCCVKCSEDNSKAVGNNMSAFEKAITEAAHEKKQEEGLKNVEQHITAASPYVIEDVTNFYMYYDRDSRQPVVAVIGGVRDGEQLKEARVICQVPTRSMTRTNYPTFVMAGKCDSIIVTDGLIVIV